MPTPKNRYIELHGEEAWLEEEKKRKEYHRKYYIEHQDELKQKDKEYCERNKKKIKERRSKYYLNNKDTFSQKAKEYREKHKEELSEKSKEYREKHKERIREAKKEFGKKYRNTKEGFANSRVLQYKHSDIKHNREGFNLTRDWFLNNIVNSSCIYCGESDWKKLGCDRIDDNLPHTTDNCVCSCWDCNNTRHHKRMSVEEFIKYKKSLC